MFKEAKWIWYDEQDTENCYGEFYAEFSPSGNDVIRISCDGDYTLFVNGKYAASNQYGDFEHYKSVDTVSLDSFLCKGINKIAILVWHFGRGTSRYRKYAPGLIFEIFGDGGISLSSGENVLARQSLAYESGFLREISVQLGFSYKYDSTKEDLWALGQGKNLKKAYPVDKKCNFIPRPNKKLQLKDFVLATPISQENGTLLYDLGKEYVGLLSFEIDAMCDTEINISYGECLENGHVKRKIGNRDFSIDYVAKSGKNIFTNYMLRFACRYLEISTLGKISVQRIGLIPQYYPVLERNFDFLSGTDKEIYEASLNTLELCMMEHYVDCPWREQCLYAFDSRNQMLSGYYAFADGNFEYAKSNLLLISQDKREDGLLSICYPCGIDLTIPSFSLHYIRATKEYIVHSGDTEIIDYVSPWLDKILRSFLSNAKNGLICSFEKDCHWNFYDWSPHADGYIEKSKKGLCDPLANILLIIALDAYKEICELCTLPFTFSEKSEEIRKNTKAAFFAKDRGVFLVENEATELINALAIIAGIPSNDESYAICEMLAHRKLIPCSLSMKCFVYDALLQINEERYKSFVLEDIRRNYAPMVKTGTVWETVLGEKDFDNAGSLCHGWSSTPIYYYRKLLNHE